MYFILAVAMLLDAEPKDLPEELRHRIIGATVRIANPGTQQIGSAVLIGQREGFAYVLTAAHVVDKPEKLFIEIPESGAMPRIAERITDPQIVRSWPDRDLAMLRFVPGKAKLRFLSLPTPEEIRSLKPGTFISSGSSKGSIPVAELREETTTGRKLLRRSPKEESFVWECATKPEKGRSGGPLLTPDGKVVGICMGTQDQKGYYCHIDEIHAALRKDFSWLWATK